MMLLKKGTWLLSHVNISFIVQRHSEGSPGRVLLMEDLYPLAGFPSDGGQALDVLVHLLHGKAGGAPWSGSRPGLWWRQPWPCACLSWPLEAPAWTTPVVKGQVRHSNSRSRVSQSSWSLAWIFLILLSFFHSGKGAQSLMIVAISAHSAFSFAYSSLRRASSPFSGICCHSSTSPWSCGTGWSSSFLAPWAVWHAGGCSQLPCQWGPWIFGWGCGDPTRGEGYGV